MKWVEEWKMKLIKSWYLFVMCVSVHVYVCVCAWTVCTCIFSHTLMLVMHYQVNYSKEKHYNITLTCRENWMEYSLFVLYFQILLLFIDLFIFTRQRQHQKSKMQRWWKLPRGLPFLLFLFLWLFIWQASCPMPGKQWVLIFISLRYQCVLSIK